MTSGFSKWRLKRLMFWGTGLPQTATLVFLGLIALITTLVIAWLSGEPTLTQGFELLHQKQETAPWWLEVPDFSYHYLWLPTLIFSFISILIIKLSPQPQTWSRTLIIAIYIALTLRYLLWRIFSTLNLTDPLNGVFSLGLLISELLITFAGILQLYLSLLIKDRKPEADQMAQAVLSGAYQPSVDILIPTYQEPEFILKRTIIGCQALDYANKTIYLLDDTRRPEVKKLAQTLGCKYISRADNKHAKAGNLNHALLKTHSELIVVFDADFVPTKNFLTRTVGFFQNPKIALVQTPQTYYNFDPISRNLGLEDQILPDEEQFYRQIELMKDGVGSPVCSGTSFVVRRSVLEEVGGFVTESICEDYFTGIRISAKGYRLVYLNEKLSAGLAAENISTHLTQRQRWGRGTLQAFFIQSNPLTIPGLNLYQRLAHLEGLLNWLWLGLRIYFLFMPLVYAFLGVLPLTTTSAELLYFFLPLYLLQFIIFPWLTYQSRSIFVSEVYSIQYYFHLSLTVVQSLLNPFNEGFVVTPKGMSQNQFVFNWNIALPLIILWGVTALALVKILTLIFAPETSLELQNLQKGIVLGLVWSIYNLIIISVAILATIDAPKVDAYDWFELRRGVQLTINNQIINGLTSKISEGGAEITYNAQSFLDNAQKGSTVQLDIIDENLTLTGTIQNYQIQKETITLKIQFEPMTLSQQRQLVELLFCRPGQWKNQNCPGELRSLFLLLKTIIRPKFLFNKTPEIQAMKVSQF